MSVSDQVIDAAIRATRLGIQMNKQALLAKEVGRLHDFLEALRPDFNGIDYMGRLSLLAPRGALVMVATDMVELCSIAAQSMPNHPFHVDLLPWASAFCLFEVSPGQVQDKVNGGDIRAVSWERARLTYADDARSGVEGVAVNWYVSLRGHESQLVPALLTRWTDGEPPTGEYDRDETIPLHRFLFCLWTLVQQRVSITRPTHISRSAQRRWGREVKSGSLPRVSEIVLRRASSASPSGEESERNWSHRWLVGGHWRNQYLPATKDHRPTWIAPYVKGPDDKPFVPKERVYHWVR